jgi:short-subunit dehydrogenase
VRSAERVAQDGYDGLMRGRRIVVPGSVNKGAALLARLMPRRLVSWMLRTVARSDLK